ncbi:MAG: 50S ribosomal protein L15, partial [Candidatus Dormibacteria bacterium]
MRLDELRPTPGSRRRRRRVGRGISAGAGKTAGRGQKGQGARSSWSLPRAFEGGQMPLTQRVPKLRGFHNRFRIACQVVNCGKLSRFQPGEVVDAEGLRRAGLVRQLGRPIKLLAGGGAPPALTVRVHRASRAAREAVTRAGGTLELLESPQGAEPESEPVAPEAVEPELAPKRPRRGSKAAAAVEPEPAAAE